MEVHLDEMARLPGDFLGRELYLLDFVGKGRADAEAHDGEQCPFQRDQFLCSHYDLKQDSFLNQYNPIVAAAAGRTQTPGLIKEGRRTLGIIIINLQMDQEQTKKAEAPDEGQEVEKEPSQPRGQDEFEKALYNLSTKTWKSIVSFYHQYKDHQQEMKQAVVRTQHKKKVFQKLLVCEQIGTLQWQYQGKEGKSPIDEFYCDLRMADEDFWQYIQIPTFRLDVTDHLVLEWPKIQEFVSKLIIVCNFSRSVAEMAECRRLRWIRQLQESIRIAQSMGEEGLIENFWLTSELKHIHYLRYRSCFLERLPDPKLEYDRVPEWESIQYFEETYSKNDHQIDLLEHMVCLAEEERREWLIRFKQSATLLDLKRGRKGTEQRDCFFRRQITKIQASAPTHLEQPNSLLQFARLEPTSRESTILFMGKVLLDFEAFWQGLKGLDWMQRERWIMKLGRAKGALKEDYNISELFLVNKMLEELKRGQDKEEQTKEIRVARGEKKAETTEPIRIAEKIGNDQGLLRGIVAQISGFLRSKAEMKPFKTSKQQ